MFSPYYHVEHLCYTHLMGNRIINTQKFLHMNICTFVAILSRNPQYNFPKMRGGQRLFGTFPRVHPFWRCEASIRGCSCVNDVISNHIYIHGLLVLCWQTSVSQFTQRKRSASETRDGMRKVANSAAARLMVRWSYAAPPPIVTKRKRTASQTRNGRRMVAKSACARLMERRSNAPPPKSVPRVKLYKKAGNLLSDRVPYPITQCGAF